MSSLAYQQLLWIIDFVTESKVELIRKGSTIEAQEKILELREAAMQLQEENLALRQENKALKEALELRSKVIWEKPYYWVQSESGKDGPYCQHCYDGERK